MKRNFIYLTGFICVIIYFSGCKKDGYSVTASGLHYRFYESDKKETPKTGEIMLLHLTYRNQKDSILYDSKILGDSFLIELSKPSFRGGLEEGFAIMGTGDSASFLVSADSVFDKMFHQPLPAAIKKGETLRFDVRLKKIMSRTEMNSFLQRKPNVQSSDEMELIHQYLVNNNVDVAPVKYGVYYIRFVDGSGDQAKNGDEVLVKYIMRSLKGEVYNLSNKNGSPGNLYSWERQ